MDLPRFHTPPSGANHLNFDQNIYLGAPPILTVEFGSKRLSDWWIRSWRMRNRPIRSILYRNI
ncbi:hypothetical protein BN903_42 [Halorubrum sp. AJ67]|nr:hypothetical protein BN903_42 [Halorubrum sp. AJ67]